MTWLAYVIAISTEQLDDTNEEISMSSSEDHTVETVMNSIAEDTTSATGNVTNMHVAIGNTALYICTGKNLIPYHITH